MTALALLLDTSGCGGSSSPSEAADDEAATAAPTKAEAPPAEPESSTKTGLELASAAISIVHGKPYRSADVTIHPWKVEWAEDETRLFLRVENRSGSHVSVFGHSARLVVDGEQFEASYSSSGYPQLSSDLMDRAGSTSGVMVFPATNPHPTSTELTVEVYSDNLDLGNVGMISNTWRWAG